MTAATRRRARIDHPPRAAASPDRSPSSGRRLAFADTVGARVVTSGLAAVLWFAVTLALAACDGDGDSAAVRISELAAAPGAGTVLRQVALHDPGTGGMESHHLLAPEGWRVSGGVEWTPMVLLAYVHLDAAATAPDGREARFHRNGSYTYFDTNMQIPRSREGELAGGKIWTKPPPAIADFIAAKVLPEARPDAEGVRVVASENMGDYAATWERALAPLLEQQRMMNQFAQAAGAGFSTEMRVAAPRVRLAYTEKGEPFEEDFVLIHIHNDIAVNSFGQWMRGADWSVYDVRSMRAPAGELDASLPLLQTVVASARPTEQWSAMLARLNQNLAETRRRGHEVTMRMIRETSEKIAETGDDIRAMNREGWDRQQEASAQLSRAWSNTMLGVDDYEMPDGSTRSLDSSFEHVFTNEIGDFVFTRDPGFDPNQHSTQSWSKLAPVTPFGGAANR